MGDLAAEGAPVVVGELVERRVRVRVLGGEGPAQEDALLVGEAELAAEGIDLGDQVGLGDAEEGVADPVCV